MRSELFFYVFSSLSIAVLHRQTVLIETILPEEKKSLFDDDDDDAYWHCFERRFISVYFLVHSFRVVKR